MVPLLERATWAVMALIMLAIAAVVVLGAAAVCGWLWHEVLAAWS